MIYILWIAFSLGILFVVRQVVEARAHFICREQSKDLLEKLQSELEQTARH
jgi:hypothetical protein